MPLENAKAELLAPTNSKEKYVFIIKTIDKTNSMEKNYILKAKSTMDMNGWVFSINSQAFICTENKRIYEIGQNLHKHERKNCDFLQEKVLKTFGNFEDFLENPMIREKITKTTREKTFLREKFTYFFELLELYFKLKASSKEKQSEVSEFQEILFKALEKIYLCNQQEKIENKGYKIEILEEKKEAGFEEPMDFSNEVTEILDLDKVFHKKFDSFQDKNFWNEFECSIKPKILDYLKRTKEMKKIFIDFFGNIKENMRGSSNFADFQKPIIVDLKKMKIKENSYLGVSRKGVKKTSNSDLNNSISPSSKNSLAISSLFKSNGDLNN